MNVEKKMDKLLYGVAYYDEYMPYDRLEEDIVLMKQAGINTVRIAESTWSTLEPQNGVFDFTSIDGVLKAMHENEISVIVGTPTYAVPTLMVKEHPDILATTIDGKNKYGPRQNMDITNPKYLFYCERVIRKLMDHVRNHPCVIGYQADNETKHYGTSGENVQLLFVKYMKGKYPSLEKLNKELGLDYWSNRINAWEDFPNVDLSINASLIGEFETFRRKLVTDFLSWQVKIINEYKRKDQFVTHNFDFDWKGHSYGIQPEVDHFEAAKAFDIAGVDIYHPTQDDLTGCEIAFCGDVARSLKQDNYLVLETQAQGHVSWLPYPGQLKLQAFSHVASGADMVEYWHYHSIHHSFETYWKGLLSQDFKPSPTYNEAMIIGKAFKEIGKHLLHLKKVNKVAVLVSNEALTALKNFKMWLNLDYNMVLRKMYDSLYQLNCECDFIHSDSKDLDSYGLIVVPPLYVASDDVLNRLNQYTKKGGHVVYALRSGYANEKVAVRTCAQPGIIDEACGIYYSQFTDAKTSLLSSEVLKLSDSDKKLQGVMECIIPKGARVLAKYDHPYWKEYAAVTMHTYGKGFAVYIGCDPNQKVYKEIFKYILDELKLNEEQKGITFPIIIRSGQNSFDKTIHYVMNYSNEKQTFTFPFAKSRELLSGDHADQDHALVLKPWDVHIYEEY